MDVLFRTNAISSTTYAWCEGRSDWNKIAEIEALRSLFVESKNEMVDSISKAAPPKSTPQSASADAPVKEAGQHKSSDFFYKGPEGEWHLYDPVSKSWLV